MRSLIRSSLFTLATGALIACGTAGDGDTDTGPGGKGDIVGPGLTVIGTAVLDDGRPLKNVEVYRSFASGDPVLIATSDADGNFASEHMYIPGDETVTVWAEMSGVSFEPEETTWRHYYGDEEATFDFVGTLGPGVALSGTVTDEDGEPLAGVEIYRGLASYEPELIDTTDDDGRFGLIMTYIPSDEMVRVVAKLEGYQFEPEEYYWRHYGYSGTEDRELTFTATSAAD